MVGMKEQLSKGNNWEARMHARIPVDGTRGSSRRTSRSTWSSADLSLSSPAAASRTPSSLCTTHMHTFYIPAFHASLHISSITLMATTLTDAPHVFSYSQIPHVHRNGAHVCKRLLDIGQLLHWAEELVHILSNFTKAVILNAYIVIVKNTESNKAMLIWFQYTD